MPTWSTGTNLRGAPGPTLRSGSGAPTATNPAVQFDGDTYVDVAAAVLYGARVNGVWPTSGTTLVGPQGTGTIQQTTGYGPPASLNAVPLTSGVPQELGIVNTSLPSYFVPPGNTSFLGGCFVNTGASPTSVVYALFDKTANAVVFSTSIATSTISSLRYAPGTYNLTGGNTYVWRAGGSGTFSGSIAPLYQFTSSTTQNLSTAGLATFGAQNLSATKVVMLAAGTTGVTYYYKSTTAAVLQTATFTATSPGAFSATFYLSNGTSTIYTSPAVTQSNVPVALTGLNIPLAANTVHTWTVAGTGSSVAASMVMGVLQ